MGQSVQPDPLMLPEIAVWSDASRTAGCATLLQGVRDLVRVIAVGGPASQPVEELAQHHGLKPDDDLRRMLTNHPAGFLLLATTQTPDPSALQIALAHETRLLLLEPLAGDLTEWQSLTHRQRSRPGPPLMPIYIPAFLQCPGWLHTADPLETLGPMHSLMYTSLGRAGHGSLFMRLMDAWLSLITLTDFPDLIFAGLSGEQSTTPADLRQAHGHLQLHARLSGNRSLLVQVSDRASQPQRELHILAELAELEVTDLAYQLHDQQGKLLDEHPGASSSPVSSAPVTLHTQSAASTSSLPVPTSSEADDGWWAMVIAQARRTITQSPAPQSSSGRDLTALALACCQAAWLSCRTGQPESPREILRMHMPAEDV